MSSTYVHYGTPSSLPSDYGLLARYANARNTAAGGSGEAPHVNANDLHDNDSEDFGHRDAINELDEGTSASASTITSQHARRVRSTSHLRPPRPTMGGRLVSTVLEAAEGGAPRVPAPTTMNENSPLLIPKIREDMDEAPGEPLVPAPDMFWEELKTLSRYTLPILGTHALEYSLVVASVVSIGHLSTAALAASTLGSMTASVTGYSIIQGFASTLDTMLPAAWTSDNPKLVGLWAQRLTVLMSAMLVPIAVVWFNAEAILLVLRQDPEVARLAAVYLRWSTLGLPAYAFNSISRRYFQSQGLFTVPTNVILVVAPINAFMNYLLVWGPEPIRLGFIGAPIASALSFNLISVASVAYGIFFVPRTAWHPLSRRAFTGLGVLTRLGAAGVGQLASEWWSWELVGLAASMLGPISLATQSVLLVSASTMYQAPFALSVAASVRIGNLLGEKNAVRARIATRVAFVMALFFAAFFSGLFLTFKNVWGRMFNDDQEVIEMVAGILPYVALFQVFDGLSAVASGILRACGKQFIGALLNLSAYYMLGIPFGLFLAFGAPHLALRGLWIGLTLSLVYSAVVGVYIGLRTDWRAEIRKVERRIAEGESEDKRSAETAEV